MANYFSYLPNLQISERTDREKYLNQNVVKNIFRRVAVRSDLQKFIYAYEDYVIKDGERPDSIATKYYGSPEYDWIVILTNNITDVYEQWPIDSEILDDYLEERYGTKLYDVVQYETPEVKDSKDNILIREGTIVNKDFKYTTWEGKLYQGAAFAYPVTRYDLEYRKNEEKRNIKILRGQFVQQFVAEFERLIKYPESSDRIDQDLKRTQIL